MSLRVHADVRGAGPPLVLLHGFTGSSAAWGELAGRLAERFRVIAFDLPGHGASPAPATPEDGRLSEVAEALVRALEAIGVGDASWLGYSLGGRVALHVALAHPERVRRLVLEGTSPGIADPPERASRAAADGELADSIERDGLERFVDAWLAQPLFATQARLPATVRARERARRLRGSASGYAAALRAMGAGEQAPLWTRLGEIRVPVLLVAGEEDVKYSGVARAMAPAMRDARIALIAGAGHAAHLEQPHAWLAAVESFLAEAPPALGGGRTHETECQHMEWESKRRYTDVLYDVGEGIARITINRPEVRNAFRPRTLFELADAFHAAREDPEIGVIVLTGAGREAFCSGGDQRIRGDAGYVGDDGVPRLNVLDLQRQIRSLPKPVIAMVAGYAIGGGHVLHVVCDLTIAADNAVFGQTGPRVGSFDGGFGASYLARIVGHKKAREIWYLCRRYDARQALEMGLVNAVVPLERLEEETVAWCRELLAHSPLALRCLKSAFNADTDGLAGIQELAGNATLLYYMSDEAKEGKRAFLEKRAPDFSPFPRLP